MAGPSRYSVSDKEAGFENGILKEKLDSSVDLKDFLDEHFLYEVNMLCHVVTKLIKINKLSSPNINDRNLFLEGFVFHARNLVEFFYYDEDNKQYARAFHFVGREKWKKGRPKMSPQISSLQNRGSVEMLHLTYARINGTPRQKEWDWNSAFKDLMKVTKIFLDLLPGKLIGSGKAELKSKIK